MAKTKESNELTSISRNRAIKIFETLGFKTANKWDNTRLQKKVGKLPTLIEGADLDDKTQKRVNEIMRAQENGVKVIVADSESAAADKQAEKDVKAAAKREAARKAEKKSKAEKTKEKQEKIKKDAEKSEKKATKKTTKKVVKKTAKKTKKGKSGIMSSIIEMLEKGFVSKKSVIAKMCRKYPDKKEQTVRNTVNWQICDLKKRGYTIEKKDDKFRIV